MIAVSPRAVSCHAGIENATITIESTTMCAVAVSLWVCHLPIARQHTLGTPVNEAGRSQVTGNAA